MTAHVVRRLAAALHTIINGVRDFARSPCPKVATEIERSRASRRELDEAQRIQRRLMPAALPRVDGFELAASWQPAGHVGGDCYDTIPLGASRLAITIADVIGKGVPAALLMSGLQGAVRASASNALPPNALCARLNESLSGQMGDGRFISFFYSLLDPETGVLSYTNAGHYPAVLARHNGAIERLAVGGPVLGAIPDASFDQGVVELAAGDRLVLYTDGLTEARNGEDEEFGEERLVEAIVANRACSATALTSRVVNAVALFTGGPFQDDATLVVLAAA